VGQPEFSPAVRKFFLPVFVAFCAVSWPNRSPHFSATNFSASHSVAAPRSAASALKAFPSHFSASIFLPFKMLVEA
jgi:hypothetical protein